MAEIASIRVQLAGRAYDVRVGEGLLDQCAAHCGPLLRKPIVPVITDAHVHDRWGARLALALQQGGHEARFLVMAPGEAAKGWAGLEQVVEWLLAEGVERGDHIIALGGGVIGDLAGLGAALVKRGCGFIQMPTTLLAQVDSSVGGKTAINSPQGKNLIGAFHQPSLVLADTGVLATLPRREMLAGYAEVIKYGILGDAAFFRWCEDHGPAVIARDRAALADAVSQSVAAKARIVAEDERETTGARALLNLGHTFGHALEAQTGFGEALLHGEAVALGMVLAARYSARRGLMAKGDAARIAAAIAAAGLPIETGALGLDRARQDWGQASGHHPGQSGGQSVGQRGGQTMGQILAGHMLHDKKMDAGTLPFVLLRAIGEAFLDRQVELADVARFLDEELARPAG